MKLELLKNGVDQINTFLKIAGKQKSLDQFVIVVTNETIQLKFVDPSHVCMVILELQNNKHYKLNSLHKILDNKPFELSIKDVTKILSRIDDNTTIINAEVSNDNIILGINFIITSNETNEIIKEIQIPAFNLEQSVNTPNLNYDTMLHYRMEIDNILDTINEINDYETETLSISTNNDTMLLEATSSVNSRKKIKITKFLQVDFQNMNTTVETNNNINVFYTMNFINDLIVSSNIYTEIDLIFGNKLPITLVYVNNESSDNNLSCFLAPKIQELNDGF